MSETTARVRCAIEGCDHGIRVDTRHLSNLQAAGWVCPEHGAER